MRRKYALDVLKYFACFLVVCIHMNLPKSFEWVMRPLLTTAVPVFFMTTGFFYSTVQQGGKARKQIRKIAIWALTATAVHLGYAVGKCVLNTDALQKLGIQIFEPAALVNLLLFNQPVWRTSLWYINALLYVLVLTDLIERRINISRLYPFIPVLLVMNLLLGTYSFAIPAVSQVPLCYSRNFLFCGLPYFLTGHYISCHKNVALGKWWYWGVFLLLGYTEFFLLEKFAVLRYTDHLFSTFFLSVSMFGMALNMEAACTGAACRKIAELGKRYCFTIYITHSIFIEIFYKLVALLAKWFPFLPTVWAWTGPVLVLATATLFAKIVSCFGERAKLWVRS